MHEVCTHNTVGHICTRGRHRWILSPTRPCLEIERERRISFFFSPYIFFAPYDRRRGGEARDLCKYAAENLPGKSSIFLCLWRRRRIDRSRWMECNWACAKNNSKSGLSVPFLLWVSHHDSDCRDGRPHPPSRLPCCSWASCRRQKTRICSSITFSFPFPFSSLESLCSAYVAVANREGGVAAASHQERSFLPHPYLPDLPPHPTHHPFGPPKSFR